MPQAILYPLDNAPEPVPATADQLVGSRTVRDVLGRGVLAPFRRDGKGDFANSADIALVRSEVRQVLNTLASSGASRGELPWRPEFGSVLPLLRFRNLDETTEELGRAYVLDALETWLFRVRVKRTGVASDLDRHTLTLTAKYDILSANTRSVIAANVSDSITVSTVG